MALFNPKTGKSLLPLTMAAVDYLKNNGFSVTRPLYSFPPNPSGQDMKFRGPGAVTYTKTKKKKKQYTRNSLQKKIMNLAGAKHWTVECNVASKHNNFYNFSPTQGIVTGSTNVTRNGDDAFLCAFKVNGTIVAPTTAGAYQYRLILGWSTVEDSTAGINAGWVATAQMNNMFLPNSGTAYGTTGLINPKCFTVLDDRIIDVNSIVSGVAEVKHFGYTVQIDQKFVYLGSSSAYGKFKNLYYLAIPIVSGGVANTTSTGSIVASTDLIFKDF